MSIRVFTTQMKGMLFPFFSIHQGVWQSSVLSPVLFLLVMNPILLELQEISCGLNINSLFLGALSHADDIRTLSTNLHDYKSQVKAVSYFTNSRNLCLSTEAVISPSNPKKSIPHQMISRFPSPNLQDVLVSGGPPLPHALSGLNPIFKKKQEEHFLQEEVVCSVAL